MAALVSMDARGGRGDCMVLQKEAPRCSADELVGYSLEISVV